MKLFKETILWYSHLLAGIGHITSSIVLISLIDDKIWKPDFRLTYQKWNLINNSTDEYNQTVAYTENSFNPAWGCFFFAIWSGLIHIITLFVWKYYINQL